MANRIKTEFLCSECGYKSSRWYGKCPGCGAWNTMEEQVLAETKSALGGAKRSAALSSSALLTLPEVNTDDEVRYQTGLSEFDRVLGGGLVKGSVVLLGGEPGIGKSTLLLQVCDALSAAGEVLYVSGEESPRQIRLRADRLGVRGEKLTLLADSDCDSFLTHLEQRRPAVAIIDSIQTMSLAHLPSSAGSVTQVRECTGAILHLAKKLGIPVILVGHVNKEGAIAGPKVLEHVVDAVLQMEGEKHLAYRILRAVKNRFGSTNEIGVFQMEQSGLEQVENPSALLLEEEHEPVSGSAVACVMEGSRPILCEVQALATKSAFAVPRRMTSGPDQGRLSLLMAVLEKRCGFFLGNQDVYVNLVGGLRVDDPGLDLAVLLSLVSSLRDQPLPEKLAVFGEVGLGGEVRNVTQSSLRIKELARLGYKICILPTAAAKKYEEQENASELHLIGVRSLKEAIAALSACRALN